MFTRNFCYNKLHRDSFMCLIKNKVFVNHTHTNKSICYDYVLTYSCFTIYEQRMNISFHKWFISNKKSAEYKS